MLTVTPVGPMIVKKTESDSDASTYAPTLTTRDSSVVPRVAKAPDSGVLDEVVTHGVMR